MFNDLCGKLKQNQKKDNISIMEKRRNIILLVLLGLVLLFLTLKNPQQFFKRQQTTPSRETYQLSNLQSDVESVINQYQPIVVSIAATRDIPVIRRCTLEPSFPFFEDPFFGDFGLRRRCVVENRRVETSGGTGFAIDSRGVILTNKHVVGDEQAEYSVLFNDGNETKVTEIYRDSDTDVALLRINRQLNRVAKLGDSGTLKVGQFVIAIGNALGEFKNSASFGIVSGLERTIVAGDQLGQEVQEFEKVIQTDAAINPGNSGGPLINLNGEVVAVNTAKANAENIGFAIPINDIKPIMQKFIR